MTANAVPQPQSDNDKGLGYLPDELYVEILSHLLHFPVPNAGYSARNSKKYRTYQHTRLALDALSNTCRALRRVCAPYLWQQIEVYYEMELRLGQGKLPDIQYRRTDQEHESFSGSKDYVVELARQMRIVTVHNPSFAEFVNVLDIFVTDYYPQIVIPELARCMTLLPNLHTVQIHFDNMCSFRDDNSNVVRDSFAPYSYPQIHTLSFSGDGLPLLTRCPNLKHLYIPKTCKLIALLQIRNYIYRAEFLPRPSDIAFMDYYVPSEKHGKRILGVF